MSRTNNPNVWQVLAVDDEQAVLNDVKRALEGEPLNAGAVKVIGESDFDSALELLRRYRIDLVVLDIRLGSGPGADDDAGREVRERILNDRFVPIVHYTALSQEASEDAQGSPFIEVVTKGDDLELLRDAIDRQLTSGPPEVQRTLLGELERAMREFMLAYVEHRWRDVFEGDAGRANLTHVLARRLSAALTGKELSDVLAGLGLASAPDSVHPLRYYLIPPVSGTPMVGDLHEITIPGEDSPSWWIVLTPTCDLAWHGKADFALLARCRPLDQEKAYADVAGKGEVGKDKTELLKRVMQNNWRPRHYYLPAALDVPHLLVDFQDLRTVEKPHLESMEASASLDSPYAEELQSRFATYFGRIGTPDLDWSEVVSNILQSG